MSERQGLPSASGIAGMRFGRLTVISRVGSDRKRQSTWLAACDCGATKIVAAVYLRNGEVKSCGCLVRESSSANGKARKRHGFHGTSTYRIWSGMMTRCFNENDHAFQLYGGRGIRVCDKWRKFDGFLADMGARPAGKSIDRIDNDRGYEPGNCRWATAVQQQNNRSNNRILTFQGLSLSIADWARRVGLPRKVLQGRIVSGWDASRAITTPVLESKFKKGTNCHE